MESRARARSRGSRLEGGWAGWVAVAVFALLAVTAALAVGAAEAGAPAIPGATYVGSEACKQCHEDQFQKLDATLHSRVLGERGRTALQQQSCESCHGPGSKHLEDQSNPAYNVRFGKSSVNTVEQRNAVCLQCHQKGKRAFWQGSTHEAHDLACTTCHTVKSPKTLKAQLAAPDQLTLCKQCHAVSVAQQMNWSHMPVREGKLQCSTCHNVHGTTTEKLIVDNSINENCYRCHTDKRGPFLWEHAPVRESCMNCHKPHGSNNIRLLRIREPRLCQQCHNENRHPSTAFSGGSTGLGGIADRRILGRSCATCHTNIHGSNHPSGFAFTR